MPAKSGKGFAVVASEVKSLAGQTAKATEEIAHQVGAIQSAATDAAQAIEQVNTIIREMSLIATTVAATVDHQNSAVASISEAVNRASGETRRCANAMSKIAGSPPTRAPPPPTSRISPTRSPPRWRTSKRKCGSSWPTYRLPDPVPRIPAKAGIQLN